jgi:alpha-ketoglutarate-dependent taurine dioxygenase
MSALIKLLIGLVLVVGSYAAADFVVRKLPDAFAAEVIGFNADLIDEADFKRLEHYLLTYRVLILRNQTYMSVETQRAFTSKFGHLHEHLEHSSHLPGYRDVNVVSNIRNVTGGATGLYGEHVENFHTDLSW